MRSKSSLVASVGRRYHTFSADIVVRSSHFKVKLLGHEKYRETRAVLPTLQAYSTLNESMEARTRQVRGRYSKSSSIVNRDYLHGDRMQATQAVYLQSVLSSIQVCIAWRYSRLCNRLPRDCTAASKEIYRFGLLTTRKLEIKLMVQSPEESVTKQTHSESESRSDPWISEKYP